MSNDFLPKAIILAIILIFSFSYSYAGLIDGGGFEAGDPPTKWGTGVCGKDATPPIGASIDWGATGSFVRDTNLSTEGSFSGFCQASTVAGTSGNGDQGRICIVDSSNRDCVAFTSDSAPFPAETFLDVSLTLTNTYGTDFNILAEFENGATDLNFLSVSYEGSTELNSGDIILFDIQLCKAGGSNCDTGTDHASNGGYIGLDNIRQTGHALTVTEPVEPIPTVTSFEMRATVIDVNGSAIENADVNITLNGDTNSMVFSNGFYRLTFTNGLPAGDFLFDVNSNFELVQKGFTGTLQIRRQEFQYLTFTSIENIGGFSFGSVDITPADNTKQIIFKVDSNSSVSETPLFNIFNSRFLDEKQYFIFTSPDGNSFVFNDTLTFGSTESNPIQKIWSEQNKRYTYSFEDTLTAGETKYYKLTYRSPYKHFFSIVDSTEWLVQLQPNVLDNNSFLQDEYSISQFANIRSTLIQHVPDVFEDETSAFEIQFTGQSDVNGTTILVGQTINGVDSTTSVVLTSAPRTFSFTIDATDFDSQVLILTTNNTSANIILTDYAIVARGFFTKRLKLLKNNGDPLDSFLLNGFSKRYLQEGLEFRIDTQAFDREGVLDTLSVQGFLDGTGANNLVRKSTFAVVSPIPGVILPSGTPLTNPSQPGDTLNFNQLFPAIIDLNGTANNPDPPRTLIVRTVLTDVNGIDVAVQSRTVTFLQFPYFPGDLIMNFFPTEKRKGKNPSGVMQLEIKDPNVLQALDFRIYSDSNTVEEPNFRTTIYKGVDFSCTGSNCNIDIRFDEYLFEDVNLTTITVFAILNTEYLDQDNNLTRTDRRIFVTPIEFDIAKIYQVIHRTDRTYRENEEIPLVLILRDDEASNLRDKLDIFISIQNCDNPDGNSGNCVDQTIRYKPTGFIYDDKVNLNYYFFRHLFILDNGSLLPDGNFIGFRATVTDKTGTRTVIVPVLTDKCKNNDIDVLSFFANVLTWNIIGAVESLGTAVTGCNTEQENIVTTTTNSEQEHRLLIDEDHVLTSPTQEAMFCLAPDTNNVLGKPLEQDLICAVWYTAGEKPIDNFRFRVTNRFSDLSVQGSTKQYKEWNIPYELIAINDIQLLKNELLINQTTSIDTVGDFFYEGFNSLARDYLQITGLQDKSNFITGNGLITNLGADLNFNKAFSPTNITGAMFFRIKGIPVTNKQDFKFDTRVSDQFETIDSTRFLDFLAIRNIPIPENEARLEVVVSDLTIPIVFKDSQGSLIIDEEATNQKISKANADQNANLPTQFIPNILSFTVQNTMFFNNFSEQESRSIVLRIAVTISDSILNATLGFVDDFSKDPTGTVLDWLLGAVVFLAILFMMIYMVSLWWKNFNTGGNSGN